ncbi:MAG: AMP-binding protein [Proteobacteria bacterium]|nr:AMP-binding protein [Pseudomonadota bacterium]
MQIYSKLSVESLYWNEYMETMPREKLDQLHLRRLQQLVKYAYEKIPMYRDLYDKSHVKPEDIKTLADFAEKIPTIDKSDVVHYQSVNPPFGGSIVQNCEEYISFYFQTSGTTGIPLKEVGSYRDMLSTGWVFKWWAHGIRPTDVFFVAFPFGIFMAFWCAYYDAVALGAQVITSGGLTTEQRVRQIMELKPTVLLATPTYAMRIAEVAREMGIDPAESSINFVTSAGEPGYVLPTIREAAERAWGAKAIDLYGISDLWGSTAWHCPSHPDRLHLTETIAYPLVIDEKGKVVPDGGKGEWVLTNYSTIMPLIKYRTHDVVEWHKETCDCGRTWVWLRDGVLGRTDHMVTIKGSNVYPTAIQTIIGETPGLSGNLEIHIKTETEGDAVEVKVEALPAVSATSYEKLRKTLANELRYRIGVSMKVEILPPKSLPRYEVKAKRVFDHRK